MGETYEREMGSAGRGRTHVAAAPAQLVRNGRKRLEQIYPKACSPQHRATVPTVKPGRFTID